MRYAFIVLTRHPERYGDFAVAGLTETFDDAEAMASSNRPYYVDTYAVKIEDILTDFGMTFGLPLMEQIAKLTA
jgi:hypothetical protein